MRGLESRIVGHKFIECDRRVPVYVHTGIQPEIRLTVTMRAVA